jgi:proteasome lid subunit RPN8/RPN11
MTFSIRATIRAFAAPEHRLSCRRSLWKAGISELARRGRGETESGAFLLGRERGGGREVRRFAYYDDLDPHCLDTGIVIFDGAGYGPLWQLCRETGLIVVADVHTHPCLAHQSPADRDHPMIATRGHIAIIIPNFAQRTPSAGELGIYEYLRAHRWRDHSGTNAHRFFYIGF